MPHGFCAREKMTSCTSTYTSTTVIFDVSHSLTHGWHPCTLAFQVPTVWVLLAANHRRQGKESTNAGMGRAQFIIDNPGVRRMGQVRPVWFFNGRGLEGDDGRSDSLVFRWKTFLCFQAAGFFWGLKMLEVKISLLVRLLIMYNVGNNYPSPKSP